MRERCRRSGLASGEAGFQVSGLGPTLAPVGLVHLDRGLPGSTLYRLEKCLTETHLKQSHGLEACNATWDKEPKV